jgi:apolipoprotein N-acyltransferase
VSERAKDLGAALLTGLLWAAAFPPSPAPWLAFVALVPWLLRARLRPATGPRADVLGFVAMQWLVHALLLRWTVTCAPPLVALVPWLGVPFSWLTARVLRAARERGWADVVAVPAALACGEAFRDACLQGLTWASLGYPLDLWDAALQWASLGRVHVVSAIAALVNVGLVAAFAARRDPRRLLRIGLGLAALVIVVEAGGAALRPRDLAPGPRVAGLQPNIPQYRKRGSSADHLRTHVDLLARLPQREEIDLLVYAETSYPGVREPDLPLRRLLAIDAYFDHGLGRPVRYGDGVLAGRGQVTLLGVSSLTPIRPGDLDADADGYRETNAGWVVRDGVPTAEIYSKRRLAPFGEYLPIPPSFPGYGVVRDQARRALGHVPDLTPGDGPLVFSVRAPGGERRAAATICFEAVFPWFFREAVDRGADFVVNQSNDAWFLDSSELDLVDQAARWRAVECGRTVFRVSNSGISTAFAPDGRRLGAVEDAAGKRKEVSGVLDVRVPVASGRTGYVRFGDLPLLFAGAVFVLLVFVRRARHTAPPQAPEPVSTGLQNNFG